MKTVSIAIVAGIILGTIFRLTNGTTVNLITLGVDGVTNGVLLLILASPIIAWNMNHKQATSDKPRRKDTASAYRN